MTGHMDSVTGLAIDQLGQYLLSGGELISACEDKSCITLSKQ